MIRHLETIHERIQPVLKAYFTEIENIFQSRIDSMYLYGSVTTKDYHSQKSDVNSLILFDRFAFSDAEQLQPIVRKGLKRRIVAPLCLSVETFLRSADTFPLELIEMKDKGLQIAGETNRLRELTIPREMLRAKIEEQIKGKLIRLREIYMEQGGRSRGRQLLTILVDAQRQLFPVFRNMLRFFGNEEPPVNKDEILASLKRLAIIDASPCLTVRRCDLGQESISLADMARLFGEYTEALFQLAEVIDRLGGNEESERSS
ncbi:MAG: hypothetical protein AB1656_16705 [Candidatus Omnitrophota bacterium]